MESAGPGPPEQPDIESSEAIPSALVWLLLSARSAEAMLNVVVSLARDAFSRVDAASVSVVHGDRFETAAATSEDVVDTDRIQYAAGFGPCILATKGGRTVNVSLTDTRDRWPEFTDAATSAGFGSVLSIPLPREPAVEAEGLGALNLYSRHGGPFDIADEDRGRAFADQAGLVLADAAALGEVAALAAGDTLHRRLSEALVSRDVLGWATGVIMAGRHCGPDEAFDLLRRTSKEAGRRLGEVAADVVAAARREPGGDR